MLIVYVIWVNTDGPAVDNALSIIHLVATLKLAVGFIWVSIVDSGVNQIKHQPARRFFTTAGLSLGALVWALGVVSVFGLIVANLPSG